MSKTHHCPFCGSDVETGAQFCQNCGASLTKVKSVPSKPDSPDYVPPPYQKPVVTTPVAEQPMATVTAPKSKDDTTGIISLAFGVASYVIFPIFAIPAIILGHISLGRVRNVPAIIGLILGYLGIAMSLAAVVIMGFMMGWWY